MSTATAPLLIPAATLTQDAQIFEYSTAANPIESGSTPRIPIKAFSADLYASGPTRIIPLDLSAAQGWFERAAAVLPGDVETTNALYGAYYKTRNVPKSLEVTERALKANPHHAELHGQHSKRNVPFPHRRDAVLQGKDIFGPHIH